MSAIPEWVRQWKRTLATFVDFTWIISGETAEPVGTIVIEKQPDNDQ